MNLLISAERLLMLSFLFVSLQKMGVDHLSDWLLGARPTSLTPIGYQSSKNPQDWLMSHKESKVLHISLIS